MPVPNNAPNAIAPNIPPTPVATKITAAITKKTGLQGGDNRVAHFHRADLFAAVFEFLPTAFFTFGLHVVVLVVKIVFVLNNSQSLYSCILLQLLIVSKSCETFSWFVGILLPPYC